MFAHKREELRRAVKDIDASSFEDVAMKLFSFQSKHNLVYRDWCKLLGDPAPQCLQEIPYLPISAFKRAVVKTGMWDADKVFKSSATSSAVRSMHHIRDVDWYRSGALDSWKKHFPSHPQCRLYTLLPSYMEQGDSSLVDMMTFISETYDYAGSYLYDHQELHHAIRSDVARGKEVILLGVTFALMDFLERYPLDVPMRIIYTGGMKGRRSELTAEELFIFFQRQCPEAILYSEYGMTELSSQAYAKMSGRFYSSLSMKMLVAELEDPFAVRLEGRGQACVIDLANVDSCAFIATEDIIDLSADGGFEVLGRLDHAEIRGCSQMYL